MLRFTVLGSGSTGNATLIEASDGVAARPTRVLVDCGLTTRELARRLAMRNVCLDDIDAVFVTHEHSDHVGCLRTLVRKHRVAVWTSEGTWRGAGLPYDGAQRVLFPPRSGRIEPPARFARDGDVIRIGALELRCFAVPHDANEPLQVVASDGDRKLGIATDLGTPDLMVVSHLQGMHALVLESNHDEDMLTNGPYPFFLRRRIAGDFGHLGNAQAAMLLRAVMHDGLGQVVAAHLSRHNNLPELAAAGFANVLGRSADEISVAHPVEGTPWLRVD
jgi:phosphoribosyl 1,2-cyclic phosphodiesterase